MHGAGAGSPPGLRSREEAPVLSWLSCHNQPVLASLPELIQQHRPWLLVGQAGQELVESPVRAQQESGRWLRWPQVYTKQGWVDTACTNVSSSDHPHPCPQKPPPSPRGRILLVPGLSCFQVAGRERSTEMHQHLLGQGDLCCNMTTVPCGHPAKATGHTSMGDTHLLLPGRRGSRRAAPGTQPGRGSCSRAAPRHAPSSPPPPPAVATDAAECPRSHGCTQHGARLPGQHQGSAVPAAGPAAPRAARAGGSACPAPAPGTVGAIQRAGPPAHRAARLAALPPAHAAHAAAGQRAAAAAAQRPERAACSLRPGCSTGWAAATPPERGDSQGSSAAAPCPGGPAPVERRCRGHPGTAGTPAGKGRVRRAHGDPRPPRPPPLVPAAQCRCPSSRGAEPRDAAGEPHPPALRPDTAAPRDAASGTLPSLPGEA